MKLWQKNYDLNSTIEAFTVGRDYLLDQELLPYDLQASRAHVHMLGKIGILTDSEVKELLIGLDRIMALHLQLSLIHI